MPQIMPPLVVHQYEVALHAGEAKFELPFRLATAQPVGGPIEAVMMGLLMDLVLLVAVFIVSVAYVVS